MTYKDVFQLAQDKGFTFSFAEDITDDVPCKIDVSSYLWGDEAEVQNYQPELLKSIHLRTLVETTLIQKWLRDECGIHITISCPYDYRSDKWVATGRHISATGSKHKDFETNVFESYEEALLQGINEALKLI